MVEVQGRRLADRHRYGRQAVASSILAIGIGLAGIARGGPTAPGIDRPTPVRYSEVEPGLEHAEVELDGGRLEVLRVDLRSYEFRVVLAADLGKTLAGVAEFARATEATVAVNGGFFDERQRPVGVRVVDGRAHGRISSGLGALIVNGHTARVVLGSALTGPTPGQHVVQAGPRLVIDGRPNRLKPQAARRTAVGVDAVGRLVIVVSRAGVLGLRRLASFLAAGENEGGLGLKYALNLDGGSSSQLVVRHPKLALEVAGLSPVADAVVLVRRSTGGEGTD